MEVLYERKITKKQHRIHSCRRRYVLSKLTDGETRPIGLYGALRKTYLREHHPVLYMDLPLSSTLTKHLADTNESAHERMDLIVKQLAKQQGVNEQPKSSDWLKWLQTMNNIQASAREIILSEIVYA